MSSGALSKALGYSESYVRNIEAGLAPISDAFARRFNDYRATDGETVILNPVRACACGCGVRFIGSPRQRFLNRQHQNRAWSKTQAQRRKKV